MTVDLRSYLADCRQLAVDEIRRFVPASDPYGPILYDLMLEYPLREAKGLRPALCIAACRALGGSLEAVLPSAAILELYHNAFLVHDDVEDGSESRRDLPTLHREHGVPIAVNVGDGMLALALAPLLENTRHVGVGKALRIMQVVARMARETAEGQAMELDWVRRARWDLVDDEYRVMVVKKTGWYSFIAPIAIGAIIADATRDQLEMLHDFGRELGIAFQIRDDVLNLASDVRYGKEHRGDLWEGKRTLILLHTLRALDAADRAEALAILAKPRHAAGPGRILDALVESGDLTPRGRAALASPESAKSAEDVERLFGWIVANDSLAYATAVGHAHSARARHTLRDIERWMAPSIHRDLLHALVDFTVERQH